ncbi:MAG: FprA family A-type flavoprotein [Euryarchaeota archaeon]|nr:FprA family A-type flavoprotein [Euryarchaeota archaeon]
MKADSVKIADGVYWVGVLDWDIRNYHGYTLHGTTYNAYLVFGEDEIALVDNTYPGTSAQMWARIKDACDKEARVASLDIIIENHIERDHSGALVELYRKFPEVPIYCASTAIKGLKRHYPTLGGAPFKAASTGTEITLGGKTCIFIEAPLLHWPDSMFTFVNEGGVLLSNDAFGQHVCAAGRFDTDLPEFVLTSVAQKFYANLITPLSQLVVKKMSDLQQRGLLDKIRIIAPSHGQIWTHPERIINAYSQWATGVTKYKATIVYDTMHYSTQKMAHALAEGLISEGVDVVMYFLHADERSEIVKDILDSKLVLFGSPTMHNEPFPSMGDIMYYLRGLRFDKTGKKKLAVTFGSKGWGGGATRKLAETLSACGFDVLQELEVSYVPSDNDLAQCYDWGRQLASKMRE